MGEIKKWPEGMWGCPLCGEQLMKWGTSCPDPTTCGNEPHITGWQYLNPDRTRRDLSKSQGDSKGIAQISNEDES